MQSLKERLNLIFSNRLALGGIILVVLAIISALLVYFLNLKPKQDVKVLITEPTTSCALNFNVSGTAPVEGFSCNKEFRDANNNLLSADYKPKPLEKIIFSIKIVNTGNTALSNLTLEDPLNNDLSNMGAKNLEYISYDVLKSSSGSCTFENNTKLFKCSSLNLQVGQSLEVSFQVQISAEVGSVKEITNVSKVYNSNNTVYCNATITTSPISNICNYSSGYCELVFREKDVNETVCSEDSDCKTPVPTPTPSPSATPTPGITPTITPTVVPTPTPTPSGVITHLECVEDSCKSVSGSGKNECDTDSDCDTETHLICKDKQCQEVEGSGSSECSSDKDCVYKRCVNNSCTLDTCEDGDCDDECDTTADCSPSSTPGNYATPQPKPSVVTEVPKTGSNDSSILLTLFILAWISSGAFFIAKAGILKR